MCPPFLEWTGQLLCWHSLTKVFGLWVGGGWFLPILIQAAGQCGNGELWWDGPRWVAVGCGLGRRQRRPTSRGIRRRSSSKHLARMLLLSIWQDIRSSYKHLALLAPHNRMLLGLSGGAAVVFRTIHQILQTLHLATANWMLLGSSGASVDFMTSHLILQAPGVPACLFASRRWLWDHPELRLKNCMVWIFPSFLTFLAKKLCFDMNFNATVLVFNFVAIYI